MRYTDGMDFSKVFLLFENKAFNPIVYIVYVVVLIGVLWSSFLILYHLIRFGIGARPKIASFIFFIGLSALMLQSIIFYFLLA